MSDFLRHAASIRLLMHRNRADIAAHGEPGKGGPSARYLFDSNIVRYYLSPFEMRAIRAFADKSGRDWEYANAIITCDYLFSAALPGQAGESAGEPVRPHVASQYREEVVDYLDRNDSAFGSMRNIDVEFQNLTQKIKPEIDEKIGLADHYRSDLAKLISETEAGTERKKALTLNLARALGGIFASTRKSRLLTALCVSVEARRLLAGGTFRSAETQSWFKSVLEPSEAFLTLVVAIVGGHSHREKTRLAIERDALSLAQLYLLNLPENSDSMSYLLVTGDDSLRPAFDDMMKDQKISELLNGKVRDNCVRSCLQYQPILNIRELQKKIHDEDSFERLKSALDDLLDPIAEQVDGLGVSGDSGADAEPPEGRYIRGLTKIAEGDASLSGVSLRNELIEDVKRYWNEVEQASIPMNYSAIVNRTNVTLEVMDVALKELEKLKQDFREAELETRIYGVVLSICDQLSFASLGVGIEIALHKLLRRREWLFGQHEDLWPMRHPDLVRLTQEHEKPRRWIRDLFTSLASRGELGPWEFARRARQEIEKFRDQVSAIGSDSGRQFFASRVMAVAREWALAAAHAERALQILGDDGAATKERREVRYFLTVCSRHLLGPNDAERLEKTEREHDVLLAEFDTGADRFGAIRGLSERGALLHKHMILQWSSERGALGGIIGRALTQVMPTFVKLARAVGELDREMATPAWPEVTREMNSDLRLQMLTNIAGMYWLRADIQGESEAEPILREAVQRFVWDVEAGAFGELGQLYVVRFNFYNCRRLLNPSPAAVDDLVAYCDGLLNTEGMAGYERVEIQKVRDGLRRAG